MKYYLTLGAAVAALAFTSAAGVAQTSSPAKNYTSAGQGPSGHSSTAGSMHSSKKAIAKKKGMMTTGSTQRQGHGANGNAMEKHSNSKMMETHHKVTGTVKRQGAGSGGSAMEKKHDMSK